MELHFATPRDLDVARSLVKAKAKLFEGARGPAYLDVKKTWDERRPGRMLRQLRDMIAEATKDDVPDELVTLDHRVRSVSIRGARVAFIGKDRVFWTPSGTARVTGDSRELIGTVVEHSL